MSHQFESLTSRQQKILGLTVRHYTETGLPVGSKTLVDTYQLGVSSATVRNELVALTELGFIMQPHTSGGRMPTEQGYRYFVQNLLRNFHLPVPEQQRISHQFHQARLDLSQWMRLAAAILAHTSQGASFVTAPRPPLNRLKHIQLISTQGRLVLMILVLFGGAVEQQMLTLAEPLSQQRLSMVANRLNNLFEDKSYDEIISSVPHLEPLEADVRSLILEALQRADERSLSNIYRDGLVNILDDEGTRPAVRILEERSRLASVLSEAALAPAGGVQVLIGGEGRWEELKDCAIILSRYGAIENFSGTVAVVGSMRMPYARNVAAVRYVANLMSGFVQDYYLDEPQNWNKEVESGE